MEGINVTRSSMPSLEEYVEEIRGLWDTHWLTNMGVKHNKFQEMLVNYLRVHNIELFTNGHMAIELSLQAFGFNQFTDLRKTCKKSCEKLEVITTPFTFASTTHAIVRNGLEPVFCDINPIDYTIDVNRIEELITENTVAIMPVHVYGNICNVNEIQRIADKHGLKVIYDAAHAFGESIDGVGVGSFGDASCFSFHATKVFTSIEGGAVSFDDENFGKELYRLKNFGIKNEDTVDGIGANAKMNEFCAAMGICNLRHIDEEIEKRKRVAQYYDSILADVKGIKIRASQSGVKSNYAYYPIVVDEESFGKKRDEVFEDLRKEGIFSRKYFYPLTNSFDCFHGKYNIADTPEAVKVSSRVLSLPMYADLSFEAINRVCNTILR